MLTEDDNSGSFAAVYIYGNYIDEPLLMNNSSDFFYLQDHLYSTAALLTAAGTVTERYEYDSYGTVTVLGADWSSDPDGVSDYANELLFQGRRRDSETGLYYYRERY